MSLEQFSSRILSHYILTNRTAYQAACNDLRLLSLQGNNSPHHGSSEGADVGESEIITVGKVIGTDT
jgi:hypothetical protein